MPNVYHWAGHEVPQDLSHAVDAVLLQYPLRDGSLIPHALIYAIAWEETRFRNQQSDHRNENPRLNAENGREDSWGYLQLLRRYGLGGEYSPEELLNPSLNVALAASWIQHQVNGGASLRDAIRAWSTAAIAWAQYERYPTVEAQLVW